MMIGINNKRSIVPYFPSLNAGYCESVNIEPACHSQMLVNRCGLQSSDLKVLNNIKPTDSCVIDCCDDNDCLHTYFSQWPSQKVTLTTTSRASTQTSSTVSLAIPSLCKTGSMNKNHHRGIYFMTAVAFETARQTWIDR